MSKRRVVVTGMGIVSPVGNDIATAWSNVVEGRSGIGPVTHFDASGYATRIAGEVRDFDASAWVPPKDVTRMDPFIHYGIAAGLQAFRDSGFTITEQNAERVGVAVGAGIGGLDTIESTTLELAARGPRKVSPFYVPSSIINMVSGHLSIYLGITGPNIALVSACTTAAHNIGMAMRLIQYGDADAMIAGGAEFATTPTAMAGFCSARAMTKRNDDPAGSSRPWDAERDGFALSNGAGVLMLEEYDHAKARGANIYGEIVGFGMSGDAYHITAPSGDGAALCMKNALHDAGVNPTDVDYVNAHGTSTPVGDLAEVGAAKKIFGDYAYKLAMSSTKSVTGHLLGAAGGVEAIFSLLAIRDGVIPPTINLENPGEGCDLDFVPKTARQAKLDVVISNSFGFGGTNGTLAFRRA